MMNKQVSWWKILFFLLLAMSPLWFKLLGLLFMSPSGEVPDRISDFHVIADAESVYCYFSLKDRNGDYTAVNGTARVTVYDGMSGASLGEMKQVIEREYRILKTRFRKVGIGYFPFKRTAIIYPLFRTARQGLLPGTGKVVCALTVRSGNRSWERTIELTL